MRITDIFLLVPDLPFIMILALSGSERVEHSFGNRYSVVECNCKSDQVNRFDN